MAARNSEIGVDELCSAAAAYKRLLNKAIKCASPTDAVTLQRIGLGLSALTKALSTVERLKKPDGPHGKLAAYPLD